MIETIKKTLRTLKNIKPYLKIESIRLIYNFKENRQNCPKARN